MKALSIVLAALNLGVQVNSYYLNLSKFLEPITEPSIETFGSAVYKFSFHENQHVGLFDSRQDKQHNLKQQDNIQKDVYSTIGLPEDVVYYKILPTYIRARLDLNRYFIQNSVDSEVLYKSLKELKEMSEQLKEKYLSNLKNLRLGNNKDGKITDVYIKKPLTSDISVNIQKAQQAVQKIANNFVKIAEYQINLDKIDDAKKNPKQCVIMLKKQ